MKSTGVTRGIDDLGRICLPKELRRVMGINEGDTLEIFTEGGTIILRKYAVGCVFCGEVSDTAEYMGIPVCKACAKGIRRSL